MSDVASPAPAPWGVAGRILLTLWVGALWAVGYLAVPVLFANLEERALAGTLAGHMFTVVSWLGLACGAVLLAVVLRRRGPRHWRAWVLAAMLALVAVGEFVLGPMIHALRAEGLTEGTEAAARFARLHGTAAGLYMVTSLLGLALAAAGDRGPP